MIVSSAWVPAHPAMQRKAAEKVIARQRNACAQPWVKAEGPRDPGRIREPSDRATKRRSARRSDLRLGLEDDLVVLDHHAELDALGLVLLHDLRALLAQRAQQAVVAHVVVLLADQRARLEE